ncbi:MAG: tetratricopeptide repeat protein [Methylophilaceae bacterium]
MQNVNQLLESARQAKLQGDSHVALEHYTQALLQHPNELNLQIVCGNLCVELGHFEEAAGHFRRILAYNKNPDARNALCYALQALGNESHSQGNFALAAASFEEVLQHQPNNAIFWYNLGNAQRELGQTQQALTSFKQAIKLEPSDADFYNNLGNIQRELGALDLAIEAYEKALKLKPDLHHALVHLVHQKQHIFDWQGLDAQIETIRDWVNNVPQAQISPFAFLSMPNTNAIEQRVCASQYVAQTYAHFVAMREKLGFKFAKNKKIRLGYLSADFRLHPLAFLITELIEKHDKTQFETFAYSYGVNDKTPARKRLEGAFEHFDDIRHLSEIDAAKKINADQIDILIDLTGFTQNSRTGIVALKPAPVSINWLGYPGTMGKFKEEPLFDWLLVDKVIAPNQADFSEQLLYLPCYQPNNHRKVGKATQKEEHHLAGNFVFCSFNQTFKITPKIFAVWMRLLAQIPNSVLWLLACNPWAKENLHHEAINAGIDHNRLVFAPRVSIEAHLERQRHADLFLDTYPYNAHTTASDALFMDLPIITYLGETFPARVAASLLQRVNLPELVAHSMQEYEQKALELARNPEKLAQLKKKLDKTRLFDAQLFARDLEKQFISVWDMYNKQKTM